jgi:hypothetical protein
MKHFKDYFILPVLLSLLVSVSGFCVENGKYVVRNDFITMADGVQLATDIYMPGNMSLKVSFILLPMSGVTGWQHWSGFVNKPGLTVRSAVGAAAMLDIPSGPYRMN